MRFLHVNPADRTITDVEAEDVGDVYKLIISRDVDFGTVQEGLSIIVYEYGLMEGEGPYFSLNGQLYSGDAILFAYDERGETVDVEKDQLLMLQPIWLPTKDDVEGAIVTGLVHRPQSTVNGAVIWSWS